jgi:hypothetical protein
MTTVRNEVHENAVFPAMCCLRAGLNDEFFVNKVKEH